MLKIFQILHLALENNNGNTFKNYTQLNTANSSIFSVISKGMKFKFGDMYFSRGDDVAVPV